MAFESEDILKRQQRRKKEQKRTRTRRLNRRRQVIIGLIAAAAILLLTLLVVLLVQGGNDPSSPETSAPTTAPAPTDPTEPQTVINLAFGGDLNVTDQVVTAGTGNSGYDYTDVFKDIAPILAGADASVINFEGNLYGAPYGTQSSSAPQELMDALAAAGVDLVQMANSCAINNGMLGLQQTLEGIRRAGMDSIGAYATGQDFKNSRGFSLRSINGVKVAFVAFTKGMDGLALPEGTEDCVNLLYKDYTSAYSEVDTEGITEILDAVELENPDVTVALLHWGSAYNSIVSDSQKQIVKLMKENGVDAIIGTHSHYVQNVEFSAEDGSFVAYSLGDLLGDANKNFTDASVILQLEITKDNTTGKTTISGYDYTPIYTATPDKDGVPYTRLLRIRETMAAYEANNVHKVSDKTYSAMKAALSRIQSRMEPET